MASKYKELSTIISQTCLAPGIYSMWLSTEQIAGEAVPGQFISVYCNDGSKILPRPISICEVDKEKNALRIVYRVAGKGTSEFSEMKEGQTLEILGPIGNGFPLERCPEGKKAFLIGGGIGIPPMLGLAKKLHAEGKKVIAVLGYRDAKTFLAKEFEEVAEVVIATEDGSVGVKGNVITAIKEKGLTADTVYSCGPTPMLRGVKAFAAEAGIPAQVSLEEKMACGIGACLACVCKSKEKDHHSNVNNKRICKDGPVFWAQDIEL